MTNAVFTASDSSIYDDLIEERYHFPRTYLRQVEAAVGDWIVYYEPRRTTGPSSATRRYAYFAIAQSDTHVTHRCGRPHPAVIDDGSAYVRLSTHWCRDWRCTKLATDTRLMSISWGT